MFPLALGTRCPLRPRLAGTLGWTNPPCLLGHHLLSPPPLPWDNRAGLMCTAMSTLTIVIPHPRPRQPRSSWEHLMEVSGSRAGSTLFRTSARNPRASVASSRGHRPT